MWVNNVFKLAHKREKLLLKINEIKDKGVKTIKIVIRILSNFLLFFFSIGFPPLFRAKFIENRV